jgi:hypothetical protein
MEEKNCGHKEIQHILSGEYREHVEAGNEITYSEWLLATYGGRAIKKNLETPIVRYSLIGQYSEYAIEKPDVAYDEWLLATY